MFHKRSCSLKVETKLCVNCFKDIDTSIGEGEICPSCGYDNSKSVNKALEYYSSLNNKYIIGRVISANSQGFTYYALNSEDKQKVVVQEFFPTTVAERKNSKIVPLEGKNNLFEKYYQEFMSMAKKLPRANHLTGVVPIIDIFLQNNTCYIVYENIESISLKTFVENKGGKLDYNTFAELFIPLLSTLSAMGSLGLKHLGISPQTLRICGDGKMRISDFAIESIRRLGSDLQVDLISGCPAYEQFTKIMPCGQASDVYAYSACMFFALTGKLPLSVEKRINNPRIMIERDVLKTIPPYVVKGISGGLQIKPEDRISNFDRLKLELTQDFEEIRKAKEVEVVRTLPENYQTKKKVFYVSPKVWLVVSFVVSCLFLYNYLGGLLEDGTISADVIYNYFDEKLNVDVDEITSVPDMVGDYYNDWIANLKDSTVYKFDIEIIEYEFSDDVTEGKIISQDPEYGESIVVGETVSLVVSQGSSIRTLPSIVGLSYESAVSLLEEEGFVVNAVNKSGNTTSSGYVAWYSDGYKSGTQLAYGTEVTVVFGS